MIARAQDRPRVTHGIQIGDVTAGRATVWGRASRESVMTVTVGGRTFRGVATAGTGFTARAELSGLAPDAGVEVSVAFGDGDPVRGRIRTAPDRRSFRDVRFLWSGDTCGQGYGINPDLGGMKIYDTMRKLAPDFFIHSGDTIYADNPIRR
jgi:alkaline phosphatase D